ncbi:MAG: aminoglycoside phosphotransferase family protein [Actinomycetota bacterium]|nr:aminoglycoside phosphotransferase family protein [Actinomycetota bacterium]
MRVPSFITGELVRSTIQLRGEAGAEWLRRLPALIADCERRWRIEVGQPFSGLWINWVETATCADGAPAVLKLSFPEDKEFRTEAEALRLFGGHGAARLLQLDLERGAMLLERCEPGVPLSSVEDDVEATSIAADVMKRLWRPVPDDHPFPLVSDWAQGLARLRRSFGGGTGPLPAALVEEAESLFDDLLASQAEAVLLHGDLHHLNILAARRQPWLAIDPKGVVGEPAYEAAALLHNPVELLKTPRPGDVLQRRVEVLAEELGLERARVRGWGVAQAVLAAYWGLEDSGRVWEEALVFAELLSSIET